MGETLGGGSGHVVLGGTFVGHGLLDHGVEDRAFEETDGTEGAEWILEGAIGDDEFGDVSGFDGDEQEAGEFVLAGQTVDVGQAVKSFLALVGGLACQFEDYWVLRHGLSP